MGNRITQLRKQRGITQETLARAVGVAQQTVSRAENDISSTSTDFLLSTARFFNVTTDYLLELSDTKRNLEGQLKVNQVIDEYYDFISVLQMLNHRDQKTIKVLMKRLLDAKDEEP